MPPGLLPHASAGDPVCHGPGPPRTVDDLRRDVAAVARALEPTTDPRLVACRGRYATAVAVLACWERGEVALLPPSLAPATLEQLAGASAPLHDGLLPTGVDVTQVVPGEGRARLARPDDAQPAVLLSTSGSTGEAALHPKTAGQLLGEVEVLAAHLGVPEGVRLVATIPAHHVYGLLFSVLLPLRRGGAFNDDAPLFVEAVAARVREASASVLVSVPAHLRTLADAPGGSWAGLRTTVSSGAPLPEATAQVWDARHGLGITEVFGSTETGGIAWRERRRTAAWTPLPGVEVGADDDGRLLLRSPFLMPHTVQPRPGDDRVELLPDGRFHHRGRLDDVVKIASKRVSLGALTAAILDVPGVRDAAVISRAIAGEGPERLHALVAADEDLAPELRAALATRFDPVAVPRFTFVDALPRTPSGKLPRQAVLDVLDARAGRCERELVVPTGHPAFTGHFPGHPVLPAVVQLHELAACTAAEVWPELGELTGLRRWRFRAPVEPGSRVTVELHHKGEGRVAVALRCGAVLCSEGELLFAQGAA